MTLCMICDQITPWTLHAIQFDGNSVLDLDNCNLHHQSFSALERSATTCELCRLIKDALLGNRGNREPGNAPVLLGRAVHLHVDKKVKAPQVYYIIVRCGDLQVTLYAFADPQSPAAKSDAVAGRLPLKVGVREHFQLISDWLTDCVHNHPNCLLKPRKTSSEALQSNNTSLPRRVIRVGTSIDHEIRLIDSTGMEGRYVALSHRWPIDPSKHFKSTKSSIDDRRRKIAFEDLPATFQDAITVTRSLMIPYLWIDSLCIIQDDAVDWEEQSALMGEIYNKSTITIMAATSPSGPNKYEAGSEGFLQDRARQELPTVEMKYYDEDWNEGETWFIRYMDQRVHYFENLDLLTRGWVMQEQMLSRRSVVYTPNQLLWRCKSTQILEVNRDIKTGVEHFQGPQEFEDQYFTDHWLGTAESFSRTDLTFESDKLPALSGMASYFSQRHQQEYCAGIFSGSVAEGLLWGPDSPGCLSRPGLYLAPSWSWTSLRGPILFHGPRQIEGGGPAARSMLENVVFNVVPQGRNLLGQLKYGEIELTGWVRDAEMRQAEKGARLLMKLHARTKVMASFILDLSEYAPANPASQKVKCLYVLEDHENVLILRENVSGGAYERIGIAPIDPVWFEDQGARKERIIII